MMLTDSEVSPFIVEMHCHSVFSPDAKRTPEELVELAASRGATLFSLTDHNHFGGQLRAARRAAQLGVVYITGIEIDVTVSWNNTNCHFVCYGCDPQDVKLNALIGQLTAQYETALLEIHPYLVDYGCDLDLELLSADLPQRYPTNPAPGVNLWFAREWLCEQGKLSDVATFNKIARDIRQKLLDRGTLPPRKTISYEEMRDAVHEAGGVVLLAHVGRYLPENVAAQIDLIHYLLDHGMDGFELYHPSNMQQGDFNVLKAEAQRLDCIISGGSDCHDAFDEQRNQFFAHIEADDWIAERLQNALRLQNAC